MIHTILNIYYSFNEYSTILLLYYQLLYSVFNHIVILSFELYLITICYVCLLCNSFITNQYTVVFAYLNAFFVIFLTKFLTLLVFGVLIIIYYPNK